MDQLQIFRLLQRFVAVRRLVAVSDDVVRQGRQDVARIAIGRNGGHARKRAHRPRNRRGGPRFGGDRLADGQSLPGGAVIDLGMARGGIAIAGDQIENCKLVRRFGGFRLIVGALRGCEGVPIGLARIRVAVAIQEFGVRLLSGEVVGFLRRGVRQRGTLRRPLATLIGLEGTISPHHDDCGNYGTGSHVSPVI